MSDYSGINKQALDRYLTSEPDNEYIDAVEKIWNLIPEEEISGDEYNKYEDFFSFWENSLSTSGTNKNGFPNIDFCAEVIKRRYRMLKSVLSQNWIMKEPNLFVDPVSQKEYKIDVAYEIAWAQSKEKNNNG